MKKIVFFFLILVTSWSLKSQVFRTVNNPPNYLWSDPASWDLGSVPGNGDTVIFNNGHTIIINSNVTVDRLVFRGASTLTLNTGFNLTINERFQIQQISAGQTQNITLNGNVNIGNRLLIRSTRDPNCTTNILGTGRIVCADRAILQGDTTNYTINLGVPIQTSANFIVQLTRADGEIQVNAMDSVIVGGNFVLNANNGSDSTDNIFNMQFAGSVLQVAGNMNFSNNGGYIQNSTGISSKVILSTFVRYRPDNRFAFHDLHFTESSVVNADRVIGNVLGDVIIDNSCALSINRRTLEISNTNLIVNGSITTASNDDSLIMSGSSASSISGSGTIETEYLVINNSSGVTNSVSTTINRGLKVTSGTFTTGDVVRLNSTSTRSAYLNEVGNNGIGAAISGSLICERNISDATTVDYRHFASPVSGSTIGDFQDGTSPEGFWTYGYPGSNTPSAGGIASCYTYDPTGTWNAATGIGNSVDASQGWVVYIGGTATNGSGAKSNYDLEVTGIPNVGPVAYNSGNSAISSSSTSGINYGFIGNPFASTINWNLVTKSNISTIAQVYATQDYNGYRATNFNAAAARIAPFQAFWVQTSGASPSVTFNENDKIQNNIPFRKNSIFDERYYFNLIAHSTKDTVSAAIELNPYSTSGYDIQSDGLVFQNPYPLPSVYSILSDSLFAQVNSINPNEHQKFPISTQIYSGQNGWYSFVFTEFPNKAVCAYLVDNLTQDTIDINDPIGYQFYLTDTDIQPRFSFVLNPIESKYSVKNSSCFGSNNGEISLTIDTSRFNASVFSNSLKMNLQTTNNQLFAKHLHAGNYVIVLNDLDGLCLNDTQYLTVFEPSEIVADFEILGGNTENVVALKNISKGSANFTWKIENSIFLEPELEYTFKTKGEKQIELIAHGATGYCSDTLLKSYYVSNVSFIDEQTVGPLYKLVKTSAGYFINVDAFSGTIEMTIFSLNGQLLDAKIIEGDNSNQSIYFGEYRSQMILVELLWANEIETIKVPKSD